MQVDFLEGALLDYWVAKVEGLDQDPNSGFGYNKRYDECEFFGDAEVGKERYAPTYFWDQAGPIIETNKITLVCLSGMQWEATLGDISYTACYPLVAAMRCFVEQKFGESVPDVDFA
jgi:hypothetical protein